MDSRRRAELMASILTCCPEVNICRWYWRLMGMCPLRDLISCMMTISRDRILSKYKLHQLKTIDSCRPGCSEKLVLTLLTLDSLDSLDPSTDNRITISTFPSTTLH
ncbi:hypothetical protein QWA68_002953 [Fusarium oxysporum]|nr:hypothetical protein QWA68_002953 [Fusarium oxysporum]